MGAREHDISNRRTDIVSSCCAAADAETAFCAHFAKKFWICESSSGKRRSATRTCSQVSSMCRVTVVQVATATSKAFFEKIVSRMNMM